MSADWEDEPCSRCVAELTMPAGQLRVIWQSGDLVLGPDETARIYSMMQGSLHQKAMLMTEAIANGWPVEVNGMGRAAVPVTTWGGDPICEPHLYAAWQEHREPATVRMAQWGGRGRR